MKSIVVIILAIIFCQGSVTAQIGSTIPSDRKTDWQNVGYNGSPLDNLPAGNSTVNVTAPTLHADSNRIYINNAISTASAASHSGNRVVVQLQSGEYLIDKPIELDETNDYIIIRGQGAGSTTIKLAASTATNIVFRLRGQESSTTYNVTNYNSGNNKISLNTYMHGIQAGDYIDIQVPDGSWDNSTESIEPDMLGQVVKVKSVYYSAIELEDDFSFVWDLADSENKADSIYVNEMTTVSEIGIEDLSIETLSSLSPGFLIQIVYGSNIWIKDIETINTVSHHIQIIQSTNVEVRRNYIHHAQGYGSGGKGYGVVMQQRTTNSLAEDNIFQSLRHSMLISRGASRNVYGYNYSREATGEGAGVEPADMSFHGNFPFLNLFEGNRADKAEADDHNGSNGHYNTYFRNYIYGQEIKIVDSDKFNVIGNEGRTNIINSSGTLNEYDEIKSHDAWNPADYLTGKLADLSYYHTSKPSFLQNYNWPPIGPSVSLSASIISHDIPARDRFCTLNPTQCDDSKIEKFSDIGVFRENQDPNEPVSIQNKNNRIFGFSSNGTSLSSETDFSFGGYDFHGITSGDYNGDGIEDIAFYRADGDGSPLLKRVFIYVSNGSSFTYLTDFVSYNFDIKGITSGDYNGDGIDDIAFYRANSSSNSTFNRIYAYTSNGSSFTELTNFSFSNKDFKGITSGDYNEDGIDDIAFYRANSSTNSTLNRIYVYKSNGSSFSSMTNFSFLNYDFEGITSGDYNGDGIDDIAVFRENGNLSEPVHIRNKKNRIYAYTSNGTSFSSMTNFSFGGYDFQGITSGDFNGDKVDDIAFYRAIGDGSPSLSRVMLYTSNTSSFSYLSHLDFETVDFEGITAGRYFNAVQSKELSSSIIEDEILAVEDFELSAYPNPFNPSTNISVRLVENSSLRLDVYNILGQKVRTLFDGRIDAGTHKFVFDANRLNSGIYFVRAQYNQKVETTKIMLIK